MNGHRLAVAGSIAAVVAAVVAGLWSIGPPSEQRLRRLDERRVSDLTQLSQAVHWYHTERRALPAGRASHIEGDDPPTKNSLPTQSRRFGRPTRRIPREGDSVL